MSSNNTDRQPQQQPATASLLSGHAQYAKGYVEETIGNVTGSEAWQQSGKEHAQQGIGEMKVASEQRSEPRAGTVAGQVEEMAGRATGCEGMETEGKERRERNMDDV